MSRIGKKPIEIPSGVEVKVQGTSVMVKGPKGELSWNYPEALRVELQEGRIMVQRNSDLKRERSLHGLTRSLISNMVTGVSKGYERVLEIQGVGYRAQVQGPKITFTIGYSYPVEYSIPEGVTATMDARQTTLTLKGIDKQKLGQIVANIRALRPPNIYKGKGIRYAGERIKLKVGKAGKK